MAIPLLEVAPKTQNQRVPGYEVPDEDDLKIYRLTDAISDIDVDELIWSAYRQIFSEHLILESYRQLALESQLRNRTISVQEFIRGLGKSEVYRQQVAELNSNYRIVDITFKRFLGRASYGKDEQIAWSIVIATKGLHGFIDAVVDSEEYRQHFGDDIVPYQRRRMSDRPFNLANPRYNQYWLIRQISLKDPSGNQARSYTPGQLSKQVVRAAIPDTFLKMAGSVLPTQYNYQRTVASVTAQVKNLEIPDTSHEVANPKPVVGKTAVALPYRYLPKA